MVDVMFTCLSRHSAVCWWVKEDGKVAHRSLKITKFPTQLAFNPNSTAEPVRFVPPREQVNDPERCVTFFKCMLLLGPLPGHPATRDQRVAPFAYAKVRESGCQLRAEDLIYTYIRGLWVYAYNQACKEYHDFHGFGHPTTRTIITRPECFEGTPNAIFKDAVERARADEEFLEPYITTEHSSVQYLVARREDALNGPLRRPQVCQPMPSPHMSILTHRKEMRAHRLRGYHAGEFWTM